MQLLTDYADSLGVEWRELLQRPNILNKLIIVPNNGVFTHGQCYIPQNPSVFSRASSAELQRRLQHARVYTPTPRSYRVNEISLVGMRCCLTRLDFDPTALTDWRLSPPDWEFNEPVDFKSWKLPTICPEMTFIAGSGPRHHYGVRVRVGLEDLFVEITSRAKRKGRYQPHTSYIESLIMAGETDHDLAWRRMRILAVKDGSTPAELPGAGTVYMKANKADVKGSVRYSAAPFQGPEDGKTINYGTFKRQWNRILEEFNRNNVGHKWDNWAKSLENG